MLTSSPAQRRCGGGGGRGIARDRILEQGDHLGVQVLGQPFDQLAAPENLQHVLGDTPLASSRFNCVKTSVEVNPPV